MPCDDLPLCRVLQAEQSRSFKRRQRRKKQQERRRQADSGGAQVASSDEHEPRAGESEPRAGEREPLSVCESSAPAPQRESGPDRTSADCGTDGGRTGPQPAARQASGTEHTPSTGADGRHKSAGAKRRKRRSTGPSSVTPDSQRTEQVPPATDQRCLPELGSGVSELDSAAAAGRAAEPVPARRREASPVVSSTEEVLRSVRALQTALGQLRSRLLAPPPATDTAAGAAQTSPQPAVSSPDTAAVRAPLQQSGQPSTASPDTAAVRTPLQQSGQPSTASPDVTMAPPADAAEPPQKTKEQIKAERKAKAEAAKLAKAAKASQKKVGIPISLSSRCYDGWMLLKLFQSC